VLEIFWGVRHARRFLLGSLLSAGPMSLVETHLLELADHAHQD
jgi:hypothetical protein